MTQFVVILTYMTQFFVIYKAYDVVLLFITYDTVQFFVILTYMTQFFVIY
jgi:hypothetical protein